MLSVVEVWNEVLQRSNDSNTDNRMGCGVCLRCPKMYSILILLVFLSGAFGDSFDDAVEDSQHIFLIFFICAGVLFILIFVLAFCRLCCTSRQVNRAYCYHDGRRVPVGVSLPPCRDQRNWMPPPSSQPPPYPVQPPPYYQPPSYPGAPPSAPPPYGFNPEINTANQRDKENYI